MLLPASDKGRVTGHDDDHDNHDDDHDQDYHDYHGDHDDYVDQKKTSTLPHLRCCPQHLKNHSMGDNNRDASAALVNETTYSSFYLKLPLLTFMKSSSSSSSMKSS